jgi:erythronate-4-phosphate dehydrogenase
MRIIADNKIPFLKGVFEPFCEIEYIQGDKIDNQSLKDADVLIVRTRTICNERLLKNTSVNLIATATIGYDHIDTEYCEKNKIKWVNAPGCNSGGVMQWFMAALLYYSKLNSINLLDKTLGVVGVGNVGKKVVRFAEAIGMKVILNDPPREEQEGSCIFRGIETIKRECDIITFHVPLNNFGKHKTHHLVNNEFIKGLNEGTILLNSSRGEVFDTSSLLDANTTKKLGGIILDVWEKEPSISLDLLHNAKLATPHIAGYSIEGKANGTAAVVKAVGDFLNLPLDDWYPEELSSTESLKAIIDCKNKSLQDVVTEAVLMTYSIIDDDTTLREQVQSFEKLRSEYNFRSEVSAWRIDLLNGKQEILKSLLQIGFKASMKH